MRIQWVYSKEDGEEEEKVEDGKEEEKEEEEEALCLTLNEAQ